MKLSLAIILTGLLFLSGCASIPAQDELACSKQCDPHPHTFFADHGTEFHCLCLPGDKITQDAMDYNDQIFQSFQYRFILAQQYGHLFLMQHPGLNRSPQRSQCFNPRACILAQSGQRSVSMIPLDATFVYFGMPQMSKPEVFSFWTLRSVRAGRFEVLGISEISDIF